MTGVAARGVAREGAVPELRDAEGWSGGGDAPTEVSLADSVTDSIAGQIAARIASSPSVPSDALDWAAVAAGYEREAQARADDPAAAAALLFEAGRILEERLGSPADALARHRQAFERDPSFRPNLLAAQRLATQLGDDAFVVDVLAALERIEPDEQARAELLAHRVRWLLGLGRLAEANAALQTAANLPTPTFALAEVRSTAAAAAGDAAALAEAWARCAETASDAALAPHFQAAAATLVEEALGDASRADALYLSAFARCPDDPFLRAAARRNAERSGRWEDLSSLLRMEAEERTGREAAAAWMAAAWVEQSRLGRLPAAIECLQRAAQAAPQSPDVLRALSRAQEAIGNLPGEVEALAALAEVFESRGAPAERKEAVDVLLRLATLQELQGKLQEAIAACREALVLEPGERAIYSLIGRLCARTGDFEGVAQAFLAEAELSTGPADRARLLLRAAEVLEGRLNRPDEALEKYREAMATDPSVVPARDALERLYARAGDWPALVGLLEVELEGIQSPRERVAQLFRIAQIQEDRLANPAAAAATWRRLLAGDPEHLLALRALARCLEAEGRWEELVEVLGAEGAVVEDPRRRAALHARRGELLEARLSNPTAARLEWEQVLALDPNHVPAQRALGRLHVGADRTEDLVSLFRREADAAPTPEAAAAILVRAGAAASRMAGGDDQAISLYREALTLAPNHLSALESLAGIYRRRGDAEALIEVLRSRAAATAVPEVRACSLIEAARLYEERLSDPDQAIAAYEEALAADPGQLAARRALDRLHAAAGHRDALRALRAEPSSPATPEELAHRVAMELGPGGDRAAAREAALAIGKARARGAPAIVALAGDLPAQARAQIRTTLSEAASDPGDITVLLMSAAAEQPAGAARDALLARAAAISPERPPLVSHALDVSRKGDDAALAARLQAAGAKEAVPAYRAHCFVRAGEAWERAGDTAAALTAYRSALAAVPDHLPALRAARAIFAQQRDWAAVRGTLHVEAMSLRDPAGAAAAWIQAGAIAEEHFADVESAVRDYRAAAERDPSDPAPLLRMEAVLAGRSSEELLALKRSRADAERDPGRAAAAWLDVARTASLTGGEAGAVLEALDRALAAQPDHAPALAMRARIRAAAGRPAEGLADYEACIALTADPRERLPLHLAAAALVQESGGDLAAAVRHLEDALAIDPGGAEALGRLARLHLDAQDLPAAAAAMRRLADLPGLSADARAEHLLGLAPIEAARGDLAAAADACRRALEAHPGDPRALRLLAEFEAQRGDFQGLASALEAATATAPDPEARLQARIALARVLADALREPGRAIAQLNTALATDPERDDARALLARILEEQGSPAAIQEHLGLLARTPVRVDSWTALYRIHLAAGARDRAYVAAGILTWLGVPPPDPEAAALLAAGARRELPDVPVLADSDWALIRHPAERGPLSDLLGAAGPAIAAVLCAKAPPPLQPLRPDEALRRTVAQLATALGIEAWELHPGPPGHVSALAAEIPVLRVGPELPGRLSPVEARFLIGRALAAIRLQAHLADSLQPGVFETAIASAVRAAVPGYAALGHPSEELARRFAKALPRRARRALESAAREIAALEAPPDLLRWRTAAARTADRVGALLCGDLPTALTLLVSDRAMGGAVIPAPERAAAALERPEVAALIAFAATEEHFRLRKRLRVALD